MYVTGGAGASPTPGSLSFPTHDYPNAVPALTGTSYSSLQFCNPNVARNVTWGGFSNLGTTDNTSTFIIQDYMNPSSLFIASGGQGPGNSATIPAAYLKSGHYYGWSIQFDAARRVENAGFGDALGYVGFTKRSQGTFSVRTIPGTVSGIILLDNYEFGYGKVVTVEILSTTGAVVETQDITLGYYGRYAFDTTQTGIRNIRFKASHWLSRTLSIDLGVGRQATNFNLLNGDIDGDDEVSILDYLYLSAAYEQDSTSADWTTPNANGITPQMCDLQEDNEINIIDYLILSNNYELTGQ
jgi:hypothetical protein